MKIALSKGSGGEKYRYYADWLCSIEPSLEIVDLAATGYDRHRAIELLKECVGIVFSGGADLDPALYGAEEYRALCKDIQPERDEFELVLFEYACQQRMPILGICRGAQLINVALKGSLVCDIPSQWQHHTDPPTRHGKTFEGGDSEHSITIEGGTLLGRILRTWEGQVNSAHHQALDRLGDGLIVSARAPDGIIEAIEWRDPASHGFLLAVQWHPERMENAASPFARIVGERFIFESLSYHLLLQGRSYDREELPPPSLE